MRTCVVLIDQAAKRITLRQSWIDTALRCAERGRFDAFHPVREEGDAAFAGTSMHAAIEKHLKGELSVEDMEEYAYNFAKRGATFGIEQDDHTFMPISFKSFDGPDEMAYHAGNCTAGWIQDVLPVLQRNGWMTGQSEVRFEFDAFTYRDWTIAFQGTCDWVPDFGNTIIDWKSSGSEYKQKPKQYHSVQPTVYALAAVNGCFDREFTWPVDFMYGVAIRLKTKARGQVLTVSRSQAHVDWLFHRVKTFVDLYLSLGADTAWPTTSEDNFLCSQRWCAWYDQCRGKFITRDLDLYGYAPR